MPDHAAAINEISYATPVARSPARTFAASMILIGGLVLVGLGGCFLIGVLMMVEHIDFNGNAAARSMNSAEIVVASFLSVLACVTFVGAVALLVIGTSALLRIVTM